MDRQFFMTFEDYKIMSVTLMISEEQVLAVSRVDFLPIFESKLNGRKRRVVVSLIFNTVLFKESVYFIYLFVCHEICRY